VTGSDINNLDGLLGIDSINGPLYIIQNPSLTNLGGLDQLTTVVGEIDINNNALLETLNGLESLTSVGSNVRVADNPLITSIKALSKITTVPGFLSVGRNAVPADLSGLENINTVFGAIAIGANTLLPNLNGLKGLKFVGGFLYIGQNPSLTSLQALEHLKTVDDYLNIEDNDALTSLSGLDSVDYKSLYYLKIVSNSSLSNCGVLSVCRTTYLHADYLISENAAGCNDAYEISNSQTCLEKLPVELVSFTGSNSSEGNVIKWQTAIEENNSGFELQRSKNGRSFEIIGFIAGNGDSKQDQYYSFVDHTPFPITYYRLKQIDYDNSFAYSRWIAVKDARPVKETPKSFSVYPNPVKDKLSITADKLNQPYKMQNGLGRVVLEDSSIPSQPVDVSKLTKCLHFITVGNETIKVLIN
jgi:hypothetical protein